MEILMSGMLYEVINSGQPWAADRARYALEIDNAVQTGKLSPSEAKEILQDLISSANLDSLSSDIQLRAALVFGVTQLVSFY